MNVYTSIVPSEDAHGSQEVAPSDRRREFISGFTAPAGVAIVTRTKAYVVADSRDWEQALAEVDSNWTLIRLAAPNDPKDWIEWLSVSVHSAIGKQCTQLSTVLRKQFENRNRRSDDLQRAGDIPQVRSLESQFKTRSPSSKPCGSRVVF